MSVSELLLVEKEVHNLASSLGDAGAVAIFGPGTVISDSAIKMLDLLIAARKQA